jgi:hypothetical protein
VTARVGTGGTVTIREETDYPFDTDVRMTVATGQPTEFPLNLRVPGWCEGFTASVNGRSIGVSPGPRQYLVIERSWTNGDVVEITMPQRISIRVWEKQGNAVTVDRGPLSYSLAIGEDWRKSRSDTSTEAWPDWEVFPTIPWNYGLVLSPEELDHLTSSSRGGRFAKRIGRRGDLVVIEKGTVPSQPWTPENVPIEIRAKGKRIPNWTMVDETVTDLQPSPVKSREPVEEIILIPMGCARLRMSVLPVIGGGPDAREWVKAASHKEAKTGG